MYLLFRPQNLGNRSCKNKINQFSQHSLKKEKKKTTTESGYHKLALAGFENNTEVVSTCFIIRLTMIMFLF